MIYKQAKHEPRSFYLIERTPNFNGVEIGIKGYLESHFLVDIIKLDLGLFELNARVIHEPIDKKPLSPAELIRYIHCNWQSWAVGGISCNVRFISE